MARDIECDMLSHYNAYEDWEDADTINEDEYMDEYITSTTEVDFLPLIGKLVEHWPIVCAAGNKKKGKMRCPCHHNFVWTNDFDFPRGSFSVEGDHERFDIELESWRAFMDELPCADKNKTLSNDERFLSHCCSSGGVWMCCDGISVDKHETKVFKTLDWVHIVAGLFTLAKRC